MPVAANQDILNGHFYAVDRDSNAFVKPTANNIRYILEKNRPFLQVVGVIDPENEPDQPDLNEQDLKDLAALDAGEELPPLAAEPEQIELTEEQKQELAANLEHAVQENFSSAIDSGFYGEPVLIQLNSGWVVHYWPHTDEYPPAMCISAGDEIIPSLDHIDDFGTTSGQAFDAAAQVVLIALAKKWQALHIVGGTDGMQWAAWAVATKNGLECLGFDANNSDESRASRVGDIIEEKYSHNRAISNAPTPSPISDPTNIGGSKGKDNQDKEE